MQDLISRRSRNLPYAVILEDGSDRKIIRSGPAMTLLAKLIPLKPGTRKGEEPWNSLKIGAADPDYTQWRHGGWIFSVEVLITKIIEVAQQASLSVTYQCHKSLFCEELTSYHEGWKYNVTKVDGRPKRSFEDDCFIQAGVQEKAGWFRWARVTFIRDFQPDVMETAKPRAICSGWCDVRARSLDVSSGAKPMPASTNPRYAPYHDNVHETESG